MQSSKSRLARPSRRGVSAIWMALGFIVVVLLIGGSCAYSGYNGIIEAEENVGAKWSEIDSQYQRRFDLVPQLVATVKGAANFEQSTIIAVTAARASVGQAQLPSELPENPAELAAFFEAQRGLTSALSRMLVTVENYPELRASANFLSLQDQLEGTENRIAVARRGYIDAVQGYNTKIRRFPNSLLASSFGFERMQQLQTDVAVRERPDVSFD